MNLQEYPVAAHGVYVLGNIAFFTAVNSTVNYLNKRIEHHPEPLTKKQEIIKSVFFDVLVGGSILALNLILSKAIDYPLNNTQLAALTVSSIAVRKLNR